MKKSSRPLRVAIIAPPWLAMPIKGYGGIELVLQTLVEGLKKNNVEVVIFGNGQRKIRGVETRSLFKREVYDHIHRPLNESVSIPIAHTLFAINEIIADGKFDVIHDNMEFIDPSILAWASTQKNVPPIIHTHHGPPFNQNETSDMPDAAPYWKQLARQMGKLYIVGISDALVAPAPKELQPRILKTVYNAVDVDAFPFVTDKKNYFCTLARFNREKAQHVAARLCAKKRYRLRMAGTVAGIGSNRKLLLELANPMSPYRSSADFKYYSDKVLPYTLRYPKITFSGNVDGKKKLKFLSEAKALLFPIDWDEPFGMAVIEALACGTPVIAMRRGAMPEIIQHGVNGFLADTEEEFAEYMDRIDEIDPAVCRQSVIDTFSADAMAEEYIKRYQQVIKKYAK